MKRTLITVALAGLFANAAFADPTLNNAYNPVPVVAPKAASQASSEQSWGLIQSNPQGTEATGLINDPSQPYYFAP